jgi:hypothetical protein
LPEALRAIITGKSVRNSQPEHIIIEKLVPPFVNFQLYNLNLGMYLAHLNQHSQILRFERYVIQSWQSGSAPKIIAGNTGYKLFLQERLQPSYFLFRTRANKEVLASSMPPTSEAHLLLQALLGLHYLFHHGIDRRFIRPGAHDEGLEGGYGRTVRIVCPEECVGPG